MRKAYHILLIDDKQSDIDLIKTELNKLDIQVQIDAIHKKEQLVDRLENNTPDLVLSEYKMPTLTGTDALRIVQERHPHLPFILVAGSIGEEKAIDAMLQGASDYVMKQNLVRLGPAILRELANYEDHKKQSRRIEKTRSQFENLVQSVNGIVWEADAETFEFLYVSPKSQQLLGFSPEEWMGEPDFWQQHIHPDDRKKAIEFCHHKTQQGENHEFDYRMFDADGEVVWLRDYVTVITKNGKPNRLYGFMVDISREKKTEHQRDKAYEIANIGNWELDLVNEELYWSKAVKKLHEVDPDYEPKLETALEFYKEGEHRQLITTAVENAIETGESFEVELKIITSNGNERWVRVVGETNFRIGKCIHIYGSTQNITERKEIEQKLRDVIEHSTNMFYRHDNEHVLSYVSPQANEFLGYTPEEAKRKWVEFVTDHPINNQGFENTQRAIDTGEKQPSFSLQLQKKNGEKIWVWVNEAPITENGKTVAIVGSLTDITEQKKYEEQLQESLERYNYVTKATSDSIWDWDLTDDTVYWGEDHNFENLANNSSSWANRIHPDDKERVYNSIKKTIDGNGQNWLEEYRYQKADGSYVFVEDRGFVIRNDVGKALRMIGAMRDVSDQKESEQSLRELYQENRLVLESTADGIYGIDNEGGCTFINKAAANMLGYNSEDCIGKNMHQLIHHHQPNGDHYQESECPIVISKNNHESCRVMDEVFWRVDGTCFNVEYTSNPMIEEGEIKGAVVAFSDITKRKQQEKELQESLEEKETLLMEIHHRVKNNLAVISSMMQLQILNVDNEYVQDILNDSIHRIKTMAMIHELLYKSPSFSKLYLNDNIEHLISRLSEAYDGYVNVDSQFSMDHVELNINQAIPCMLLMNEVVTNILKHGFKGRKHGNINVEMFEKSDCLALKISDDGVGLPDNFDSITDESSVGLILIETLAEQLGGEYSYQSLDNGTLFTLAFKKTDVQGIGNAHLT